MILRIIHEIIDYPNKRMELLNGRIDKIVDPQKYVTNDTIIFGELE